MRIPTLAAALLLVAAAAQAQAPMTGTTAPAGSPTPPKAAATPAPATPAPVTPAPAATAPVQHRRGHTLQERFDAANVTHDGHLTQEQARAKMPSVARDFADIDTDHKGYVTVDEIRAHSRAVRAAHRAAKKAATPAPAAAPTKS